MTAREFPSLGPDGERRLARLRDVRIHVVCTTAPGPALASLLDGICAAGADVIRLRDEHATEEELRTAAGTFRSVADRHGALFVLSGFPGLACDVAADGVHLDQVDIHPDHARSVCGPDLLVGRTVHSLDECIAAADEDIDYLTLGPVLAPADGLDAIGLDAVHHAARHAALPWAVGGGVRPDTVAEVVAAGATSVVVTRTVVDADDPATVIRTLRRALPA